MSTLPNLDTTLAILAEYEEINHRCLDVAGDESAVLEVLLQRRQELLDEMADLNIPMMRQQLLAQKDTCLEDQLDSINGLEARVEAHLESVLEGLREGLRSNQKHAKALNLYQSHNPVIHGYDDEDDDTED